jgi:hypothetical protein
MNKLVPVFAVSTTLISNACKEHHIPTPPRGYWSKVRAGRKFTKPQLPKRSLGMSNNVKLGRPHCSALATKPAVYEPLADLRKHLINLISPQHQNRIRRQAPSQRNKSFWQYLISALAGFGAKVMVELDEPSKAIVKVYHQKVAIWIIHTETTIAAGANAVVSSSVQVSIAPKAHPRNVWRTWQDAHGSPVEAILPEIAAEILVCAEFRQREVDGQMNAVPTLNRQPHHLGPVKKTDF